MSGIRHFDFTYGLNLAPAGFRKICAEDGSPRALFTSVDMTNTTYLWVSSAGETRPISEVALIYDDDPTPEGFEVLNKNICRGSSRRSYLSFRRSETRGGCSPSLPAIR